MLAEDLYLVFMYQDAVIKKGVCGIYMIYCEKSHRGYIGQSRNIRTRWLEHKSSLRKRNHKNSNLQEDYNIYGGQNFRFLVLEFCQLEELNIKELEFCKLVSRNSLYNSGAIGKSFSSSEAVRLKIRNKLIGRKLPKEHKDKISKALKLNPPRKGKPNSEAHKSKLLEINLMRSGETSSHHKLTNKFVFELRSDYMNGIKCEKLAIKYNINVRTVFQILDGKTWEQVPFPENFKRKILKKEVLNA